MVKHVRACGLRVSSAATALGFVFLLLSCAKPQEPPPAAATPAPPPAVAASPSSAPTSLESDAKSSTSGRRPFAEIFRGTGNLVASQPVQRSASVNTVGDFSMNFVNADVRDVAKAVLGDLLKVNYLIDPGVQGPITLQTSQPVSRDAVLPALEAALRLAGIALVRTRDDIYQLLPVANAPRQNSVADLQSRRLLGQGAGFAVVIVPLHYIAAAEMQHLLEPLVPAGSVQEVDAARNLLVIAGTQQDLANMLDDVALFDVDWLSGMSFAFFSPQSVDAKTLAKELNEIVGGHDSPMAGLVRLITIEHQNAVLAISPQPKYLDELAKWAERLDQPGESEDRRIYVYHVQHGRAADLAAVLNKLLTGYGGGDTNAGAIRPGETAEAIIEKPSLAYNGAGGGGLPGAASAVTPGTGMVLPARPPGTALPSGPLGPLGGGEGAVGGDQSLSLKEGSGAHITADEISNALLIMATPREYAVLEKALHELDVVPMQVLLEAAIAEVTLTNDLQYGVQYFFNKGRNQAVLSNATLPIAAALPGFAYTFSAGANIVAILSALESVTQVDVVSAPEVMVVNNQTATLQVGDQVPIATQSAVSVITSGAPVVNTIQYRDTGVTLKVTPRVNQGGTVMMDVSQEVSDVSQTSSSTLNSPTINQRKITSTIAVHDGETIAIGGLISDSRTKNSSGIPILSDIPVLGSLFSTKGNQGTRTELVVLITPHVIENAERARSVTDELRRKLPTIPGVLRRIGQ
jgi:general secretion pathway protein D